MLIRDKLIQIYILYVFDQIIFYDDVIVYLQSRYDNKCRWDAMNLNTAQLGGSWPRIPCINHSTIIVHNISINQISINNYPSWLNRCVGILMQHQTSTGFNYYSVNVLHFSMPPYNAYFTQYLLSPRANIIYICVIKRLLCS